WLRPERAVLCSSYSGDTEETLACYEATEALGTRRVVATTGGRLAELARRDGVPVIGLPAGFQPRAVVGYMFVAAAEVAAPAVVHLETEGESRTERLLWAVLLGDLVSLYLAARRGVDPGPVAAIERLKDELGSP